MRMTTLLRTSAAVAATAVAGAVATDGIPTGADGEPGAQRGMEQARRRPWLAAAECAVLAVSSADLVRRTSRASRGAGMALAPYAALCAFATALSTTIAVKNRRFPMVS